MKIGILGTGSVGLALGKGWARENHQLMYGSRNPASGGDVVYGVGKNAHCGTPADAAAFGDVVVVAVPYDAAPATVKAAGAARFKGKVVVDATNPSGDKMQLAVGGDSSAAEEIKRLLPGAHVVKAFNTVFAENMVLGRIGAQRLAGFVAGDDAKAKQTVMKLVGELGFEPVDAGPLRVARYLEPMAMLLIQLAYGQKMGPGIGFSLPRKAT